MVFEYSVIRKTSFRSWFLVCQRHPGHPPCGRNPPSIRTPAHAQNEEYCTVAIHNPLTWLEGWEGREEGLGWFGLVWVGVLVGVLVFGAWCLALWKCTQMCLVTPGESGEQAPNSKGLRSQPSYISREPRTGLEVWVCGTCNISQSPQVLQHVKELVRLLLASPL